MAKSGKIYYSDFEFSDDYVSENFGFPVRFIITDNAGKIIKEITYNELGEKSEFAPANIDASNIDPYVTEWKAKLIAEPNEPSEDETEGGLKVRADDNWRTVNNNNNFISIGDNRSGSFHLAGNGTVNGFVTKIGKHLWKGRDFVFYSQHDTLFKKTAYINSGNSKYWSFKEDYEVKAGNYSWFKEKYGEIVLVSVSDSSATFPTIGNNGNVLVKDSTVPEGVKWSDDFSIYQTTITTNTSITTNTTGSNGKSQNGRNVKISNGVHAINLICETSSDANFVASYTKLGSAAITFAEGTGSTLVQIDGTAILNGKVGSTACLTRNGDNFYLQINNR